MTQSQAKVFVGSSSEGLKIARAIQVQLSDDAEVVLWNEGVFQLMHGYLETLVDNVKQFDYGIFVLRSDDTLVSRGNESGTTRGNVLFELGMFIGQLGRGRTFAVYDSTACPAVISDLHGVSLAPYDGSKKSNIISAIGPACNSIRDEIESKGAFSERQKESVKIFENQPEANIHIINKIKSANPPIKKATVLQYSSQAVRDVVEALLNANVSVDLLLKNPQEAISELQKGAIDRTIKTYHNIYRNNEEICNNLLKVFLCNDTSSIRAIRLDEHTLAIGYYIYEGKSIYGHNQPLFLCNSSDSQTDSVFNKFNQYIEHQIENAKLIDIREYADEL